MSNNTIDPLGLATSAGGKPEWIRPADVRQLFGISRSACYELISSGVIRSCSLRKRGRARGVRLVSYDSLCAYLNLMAEGGQPEKEG